MDSKQPHHPPKPYDGVPCIKKRSSCLGALGIFPIVFALYKQKNTELVEALCPLRVLLVSWSLKAKGPDRIK